MLRLKSDKTVAELTEKLQAIEAENLKTSRVSILVDKGIDKTEAESVVETFDGITDEQFDALVSKLAEAPFHYKKDEKKKKEDEEKSKADSEDQTSEEKAEAEEVQEAAEEAEDAKVLDEAQAEEAPALAAQSEDNSEAVVASLNEYFDEVLSGPNNKS